MGKKLLSMAFGLILIVGCGASQSITGLFISPDDKERSDVLFAEAKAYYDQGSFDKALAYGTRAHRANPMGEETAQLLGYIYLAKAGMEPFTIMSKLITLQNSKTSSSEASSTMSTLGAALLDLSQKDLETMATKEESTNPFFQETPVYLPNSLGSISEGARSQVSILYNLNMAIQIICPFVDPTILKDTGDSRHDCQQATGTLKSQAQSHVLFALSHLVEALVLNQVILYQDGSFKLDDAGVASNTNIFKRVSAINRTVLNDEIADYVDAVTILKNDLDKIFDASPGSMLYTTLVDMRMVVSSFKAIKGVPDSVLNQLEKGMEQLEEASEKAGKSKNDVGGQSSALKEQMNQQIVSKLGDSITKFNEKQGLDESQLTEEQKAQRDKVCQAYQSLIGDVSLPLPTGC